MNKTKKESSQEEKHESSKRELKPDIQFLFQPAAESLSGPNLLEIVDLNKSFGGLHAIRNLTLGVKKGEVLGFIGPNGAGKTTLVNLVTGLLTPDSGVIRFKGEIISGLPAYSISLKGIGRTFQIVRIFQKMTVLENLIVAGYSWLTSTKEIEEHADGILRILKLEHLREEYAGNISGGQQKLLELGRTLMFNPELLILDEPFVGVHPEIRMQIYEIIKMGYSAGKTFLIISHDMKSIFRLSNRLVVLSSGRKIADGDPGRIRHDERVLEAYLGD